MLNSILVYVAPTQYFGALIALMQPGGAKVDFAAIRLLQEVPQTLSRTSIDARMRSFILDLSMKVTDYLLLALNRLHMGGPAAISTARHLDELAQDVARFTQNAHNTEYMFRMAERYLSMPSIINTKDILQTEYSLVAGLQFNIAVPFEPNFLNRSISRQKCKRVAKTHAYPPPKRPHGGKHLRRAGTLAQPGGRQRGKDRRAPRK